MFLIVTRKLFNKFSIFQLLNKFSCWVTIRLKFVGILSRFSGTVIIVKLENWTTSFFFRHVDEAIKRLAINNIVQWYTQIIAKYYDLCIRHNIHTQKRVINKREIMKQQQCSSFANRSFYYIMQIMKKLVKKKKKLKVTEEFSIVRNSTLRSFYTILYIHLHNFIRITKWTKTMYIAVGLFT